MKIPAFVESCRGEIDKEIREFSETIQRDYERLSCDNPTMQKSRKIAEAVRRPWAQGGPEMARISNQRVVSGGLNVNVRIFEPNLESNRPALVYLHGGGWTLFNLETHDRLMREYAARTGFKVIGVDYSLSPESKFPCQINEVTAVLSWLQQCGAQYSVDPGRIAIGGDSAGANLAIATCLKLRDSDLISTVQAMVLNYGAFDGSSAYEAESVDTRKDFLLTYEEMQVFWRNYLRGPDDVQNPLACPILADLVGLPPVFMAIADCDILLEENLSMASRLQQAEVSVQSVAYPGTTHSFLEAVSIAQVSRRALDETSTWLVTELSGVREPLSN